MRRFRRFLMTTFLVVMLATAVVSLVMAEDEPWLAPVNCQRVNVGFGQYNSAGSQARHTGEDFACPTGTPVLSPAGGEVVWAEWYPKNTAPDGHGITLWIYHGDGADGRPVYTVYAHLSKITVSVGDHVQRGQKVAETGNTGYGTGPHLHLAIARKWPSNGEMLPFTDWEDSDDYIGSAVTVTSVDDQNRQSAWQPIDWRAEVQRISPSMQVYGPAETDYPLGIIIHHTVGSQRSTPETSIRTHYGRDRAPYNFIIDRQGNVYQTMDWGRKSYHALEPYNTQYVSISVDGHYGVGGSDQVTPEIRKALVQTIRYLIDKGVNPTLKGHRDVGNTECPGYKIYDLLPELLEEATIQGPSWVPQEVQQIGRVISLVLTFQDLKLRLQNLWWLGWVLAAGLLVLLVIGRTSKAVSPDLTPHERFWSFSKARWASWTFVTGVVGVIVSLVKGDTRMTFVASYIALGCLMFLLARMRERRVKAGELTPLLPEGGRILVTKVVTWTLGASGVLLAFGGLSGWQVTVPVQAVDPPVVSQWDTPSEMQDLPDFFKTEVANLAPEVDRIAREENVPPEVSFVLWLKESGGRRQNPANGEGLFGFYDLVKSGEYYFQPSLVSDGELLTQLRLAAKEFRRRSVRETTNRGLPDISYSTTDPDVLGWSYVVYNGNILCGGAAATNWQDHAYVMNGYDSAHTGMMARTSAENPSNCVKLQIIGAWPAHIRVSQLLSAYR